MTYKQANQLVRELEAEGHYTSVESDLIDYWQRDLGYKVIAVVSQGKKVVEEDHYINVDRTGTIHI